MINRKITVSVVISLLVGIGVGSYVTFRYMVEFNAQFITQGEISRTQYDLTTKIKLLDLLRSGENEDAINFYENLLDADFMTAGSLVETGHKLNPKTLDAVAFEVKARKISEYEPSDPKVRAYVNKMLEILMKNRDKTAPNKAPQATPKSGAPEL